MPRLALLAVVAAVPLLVSPSSAPAAENPFCLPGGQQKNCSNPQGVGSNFETGNVYVADKGNDLVKAFEFDGDFIASIGEGELTSPSWVEVDNDPLSASQGDIWVTTNSGDFLVKKFKPNGEFVEADSFGDPAKQGTGSCEFKANDPIAVGPAGKVYVANSYDKDGEGSGNVFVNRVLVFDSVGSCLGGEEMTLFEGAQTTIRNFAVDSTGHIYVTVASAGGVIRKYGPGGAFEYELDNGLETEGLGVDGADNLFAKQRGETKSKPIQLLHFFTQYPPSGTTPLKRFDYKIDGTLIVPDLATYRQSPGDVLHLYSSEGTDGIQDRSLAPPGPVVVPQLCRVKAEEEDEEGNKVSFLGNTKATLYAEINPEGKATSFKFEYLTQEKFEDEGGFIGAQSSAEESLDEGATDFVHHEAELQVTGLDPETEYRCRVVARNADSGPQGTIGQEGTFKTKEGFEFGSAWSGGVGTEEATVFVEGNPLGVPATGQIEYVDDAAYQASGFDEALSAPDPAIDFGASEAMQLRSATLTGLVPGTLYHYRLRVKNGTPPEGFICPQKKTECPELERTFRTFGSGEGALPDDRAWELVSPAEKNGAEVAVPGSAGGFAADARGIRIQAAAGSGEALTYASWTSFGDAEGAPGASQYLSKRGPGGWSTANISPFGFLKNTIYPPYVGFTPDLRYGAFKTTEPVLTPDCREDSDNLYLRDYQTGDLRCLDPEVPDGPAPECLTYAGRSDDGSVFVAGRPEGGEEYTYSLYRLAPDGTFHPISVLPNGDPAAATQGTAFGAINTRSGIEACQVTRTRMATAVSDDGSKAFWTFAPVVEQEPTQLYVHVEDSQTFQLDAPPAQGGGNGPAGGGVFQGASADGSVAYFTSEGRLLKDSKAKAGEPNLYRYQVGFSKPLTDLTSGDEPGDVKGVVGISEDGSHVYFVAGAVLSGEEENEAGQKATEGANNLYLHHEGETRFIGILASATNKGAIPGDEDVWSANPRDLRARVSPDGKHLAFLSIAAEALADYDPTIAEGDHCRYGLTLESAVELTGSPECPQAFIYEAEADKLTCASCNPSGSRPLGPTVLPGWSNPFEGPRFLSGDGDRIFFASFDALVPADQNGKMDVYEFEFAGTGSCVSESPAFDPVSGGCHFLISSGRGEDETYLLDASSNGRDVFFATRAKLNGWDTNDNFDIYDARAGGGFPGPAPPPPVCEGEGCKPSASAPPSVGPSPGTAGFRPDEGNVPPPSRLRCPKGKRMVRKAGKARCVKPGKAGKGRKGQGREHARRGDHGRGNGKGR